MRQPAPGREPPPWGEQFPEIDPALAKLPSPFFLLRIERPLTGALFEAVRDHLRIWHAFCRGRLQLRTKKGISNGERGAVTGMIRDGKRRRILAVHLPGGNVVDPWPPMFSIAERALEYLQRQTVSFVRPPSDRRDLLDMAHAVRSVFDEPLPDARGRLFQFDGQYVCRADAAQLMLPIVFGLRHSWAKTLRTVKWSGLVRKLVVTKGAEDKDPHSIWLARAAPKVIEKLLLWGRQLNIRGLTFGPGEVATGLEALDKVVDAISDESPMRFDGPAFGRLPATEELAELLRHRLPTFDFRVETLNDDSRRKRARSTGRPAYRSEAAALHKEHCEAAAAIDQVPASRASQEVRVAAAGVSQRGPANVDRQPAGQPDSAEIESKAFLTGPALADLFKIKHEKRVAFMKRLERFRPQNQQAWREDTNASANAARYTYRASSVRHLADGLI